MKKQQIVRNSGYCVKIVKLLFFYGKNYPILFANPVTAANVGWVCRSGKAAGG